MRILCVAAALAVMAAPAKADISVIISKSQQRMAVSVDGGPPSIWTVSTGRPGYPTPSGSFRAIRLEEVYYSKKYDDAPMPNSVFFYGGYAIHGTLEERRLGNAVSHGCVRLARVNAAQLYALVRAHGMSRTRISITDGPLPYSSGVPMARVNPRERDVERGYERSLAARSVAERYVEPPRPVYRGFDQFGSRDWRADPRYVEPQRRVQWREEPVREREVYRGREVERQPERLVPGRTYSEAEMRRIFRDNGWRWDR
jgi:hypothetical protein